MIWKIVIRECRCGRLFELLEPFDLICDDCWHEAMGAGEEAEDDDDE